MRPSKDEYYMNIAMAVAQRSTCLLRQYGAIIVRNDVIVSTGYNGAARKVKDCLEIGFCLKENVGAPKGRGYEFCPGVHSEENAIINAARQGSSVIDGTLYIAGRSVKDGSIVKAAPCERCKRAIINAGIKFVVFRGENGTLEKIDVSDWIKEDEKNFGDKIEKFKGKKLSWY
jgi:dCMP deaminase